MKICENHLKRIQIMAPDMKTSRQKFAEEYKNSILATVEMKLLAMGLKFKSIYESSKKKKQIPAGSALSSELNK